MQLELEKLRLKRRQIALVEKDRKRLRYWMRADFGGPRFPDLPHFIDGKDDLFATIDLLQFKRCSNVANWPQAN